jgi:hypothetical protein
MMTINTVISLLYYGISLFFLAMVFRNFLKTKDPQEAILYCLILIPFALRVLRLK